MIFTERKPGLTLRNFSHAGEIHPYVYVFPQELAHHALGVPLASVEKTLLLLDASGDLLTLDSDNHRFTRNVHLPDGGQRRLIVLRECADRIKAERIARGRWHDSRRHGRAVAWS